MISKNLQTIKQGLPSGVRLVVVTKFKELAAIEEVYRCGHVDFGENRAQELARKASILPADIKWHFIGHLQTNKVRVILPHVSLIHSIDSFRLLESVDKESARAGRITACLLQFHIAREESKFGFDLPEARQMLESESFRKLLHVNLQGVMGMATLTSDEGQIREEFRGLTEVFKELKTSFFPDHADFREISMGMSDDYPIAIEEGSSMIRVGRAVFG